MTGGASGIGAAMATKLVDGRRGRDRRSPARRGGEVANAEPRGGKAHAIELDVSSFASFQRPSPRRAAHRPDRLPVQQRRHWRRRRGRLLPLEDWNDVFDVNLRAWCMASRPRIR